MQHSKKMKYLKQMQLTSEYDKKKKKKQAHKENKVVVTSRGERSK